MRNLLSLLGLVIVVVAGVGWYQDWYKLSVSRNIDGTLRVQTDVDTQRAGKDLSQFGKKVEDLGGRLMDKTSSGANTAGSPPAEAAASPPAEAAANPSTPAPLKEAKEGAGWLMGHVLGNSPNK